MKKNLSCILSLYFLVLSLGINVNKHYCAGELEKIAFFTSEQESCCDSEKNPDCCKSENIQLVFEEDFSVKFSSLVITNFHISSNLFLVKPELFLFNNFSQIYTPASFAIPPLRCNYIGFLHILFRSIII